MRGGDLFLGLFKFKKMHQYTSVDRIIYSFLDLSSIKYIKDDQIPLPHSSLHLGSDPFLLLNKLHHIRESQGFQLQM